MEKLRKVMKKEVILILIIIFLPMVFGEIITKLGVNNTPPYLNMSIPNQSWPGGEDLPNAFNLDDYFTDDNGDILNYSYSFVDNVTILIDENNSISFFPDVGFSGTRIVYFNASDGEFQATSNPVYLNIGNDTDAPKWSFPSKSSATIYQNSFINFSSIWTDNIRLRNFIFSIDQGGGWTNYPSINFSGKQNTSIYKVQISAAEGHVVYWKFYAYDVNGNMNETDVQSFNVSTSPYQPPGGDGGGGGGGGSGGGGFGGDIYGLLKGAFSSAFYQKILNFTVDPESVTVSIKKGELKTRILRISNTGTANLTFNIFIEGLEQFIKISPTSFILAPGEKKEIILDFYADDKTLPEQYFGSVMINASSELRKVLIVLDVKSVELGFDMDVNISSRYKIVSPGSKVKANISIYSLRDIRQTNLTLYTAIKDFEGNIFDSNEEQISVISSLSLERELSLPREAKIGQYIFYARMSNENIFLISSDSFEAGTRFRIAAFLKSSFIFLLILLLSLIVAILMLKYRKDKERERILNLYLMVNELKNLIKENKIDEAVELYIRIKTLYKEPISKEIIENKAKLKEEVTRLSRKLQESKEISKDLKDNKEETKKEDQPKQTQEKQNIKKQDIRKEPSDKTNQPAKKEETKKEEIKPSKISKLDNSKTGGKRAE